MPAVENFGVPTPGFYSNANPPKLPKPANRTVKFEKEIKYCSECPHCGKWHVGHMHFPKK